ncbi:cleavage stimulating factor 64 isoform X1 [Rutidosis leptorrhynchoides]|uniref:cleavage stimulating factor 64 isoform X1 n=1 Tax=Rutidosis leptorrhynchoides TaxID=125765 RepID=UPI003A9927C1
MANSQHRCVFVGNIPYDATEEQLLQICEEVGPVVSFRIVIDRETGKPKGYGFCEYKDEETALSARRNLHGYDINGRQLRVDFAENDKNNDKSREQGRSGPGLSTATTPQKQIGGPTVQGDPSLHQPIGLQVAMAAAVVMAGTFGGGQGQPILGTDPLTLHFSKIPKAQLIDVLTEVKAMATQNKEQARQLLLAHPQLSKSVLQAHIMLKTVPPHMLQMPNAHQLSGPHALPIVQGGPPAQPSSIQPLSGLPPLAQNKVQPGFIPQSHNQPSSGHPTPLVPNPYAAPLLPTQAWLQTPQPSQRQVLQQSTLSGNQLLHSQPNVSLLNRVEKHTATPLPLLQYSGTNGAAGPVPPSIPDHKLQPHDGTESALLEQVLNLSPEQLSSLPQEQQQQVIQLQQMLRKST